MFDKYYDSLPDGKIQILRDWTCPNCNVFYKYHRCDSWNIHEPHKCIERSEGLRVICSQHKYGKMIDLMCTRCPGRYMTKNIGQIGSRGIFPITIGNNECCHNYSHVC